MAIKTENLAIIMTDIVGFTEATASQSRSAIDVLLATHNRILLPIVRRYSGRHIKSIGDALLLAFRSPTDAMLCAMAMQDALYEYNRGTLKDKQIHIRIGASLGEVRVTRNDIFGEPVNLTSRVTGVTPADEIYLSEALYMAMNKAEVPSQEVGWKELKGISQPVRVYNIPRFAVPRLVADVKVAEDLTDLVYPYGGAHLADDSDSPSVATRLKQIRRGVGSTLVWAFESIGGIFSGTWRAIRQKMWARVLAALALAAPLIVFGIQMSGKWTAQYRASQKAEMPSVVARTSTPEVKPTQSVPAVRPASAPMPAPASTPAPGAKAPPPGTGMEPNIPAALNAVLPYPNVSDAKRAYKDKRISKDEYKRAVKQIEAQREREIDYLKHEREIGNLTTLQYKLQAEKIEKKYD